jgi:hypothetical protein
MAAAIIADGPAHCVRQPEQGLLHWLPEVDDQATGQHPGVAESTDGHLVIPVPLGTPGLQHQPGDLPLVQLPQQSPQHLAAGSFLLLGLGPRADHHEAVDGGLGHGLGDLLPARISLVSPSV